MPLVQLMSGLAAGRLVELLITGSGAPSRAGRRRGLLSPHIQKNVPSATTTSMPSKATGKTQRGISCGFFSSAIERRF